jgi:molybdopterin-binding protein
VKTSARNTLQGTIKKIDLGAVNAEVTLELPGGQEIVSIITISSVESLGLKEGEKAFAVIKASNVMMGTEHH